MAQLVEQLIRNQQVAGSSPASSSIVGIRRIKKDGDYRPFLFMDRGGRIMKVIFLDIDGVLNSREYDRKRYWETMTDIDESRLPLVKEIVENTGAKIVLSSTWRVHWNKNRTDCDEDGRYIADIFERHGLQIYDKTPDLGLTASRRNEIAKWLSAGAEPIENFVILDDYAYNWGDLSAHFVKTNPVFGAGLEEEHVRQAIAILNQSETGIQNFRKK